MKILFLSFLVFLTSCASRDPLGDLVEENNKKPVSLTATGSRVRLSDVAPSSEGRKCEFVKKYGNIGIRNKEWNTNDFRNRAGLDNANYLHYVGLVSSPYGAATEGRGYKCPAK